ncbi:MAG TPA: class I SAM-dependent methyltransferase family protein, partial [Stellaceae bacterium]
VRVACCNPTLLGIAAVAANRPACARLVAVAPAGRSAASYTTTRDTTSGSAQAVIETISELKVQGISTELLLVDSDISALDYARALSRKHGIEKLITIKEGDVLFFDRAIGDFRPDIIEMMGMIDYLRDTTIILLIRKIQRCLKVGGYFFTCHIHPNIEAYFLRHVVNWEMTYRSREALCSLIEKGGFSSYRLFTEPHRIHSVAVARKIADPSLSELMKDACGMIDSGFPDLGSNPKHLEGFGQDSMGR